MARENGNNIWYKKYIMGHEEGSYFLYVTNQSIKNGHWFFGPALAFPGRSIFVTYADTVKIPCSFTLINVIISRIKHAATWILYKSDAFIYLLIPMQDSGSVFGGL